MEEMEVYDKRDRQGLDFEKFMGYVLLFNLRVLCNY